MATFVIVSDDIDVFSSQDAAEKDIEAHEVRSGSLRLFDLEGHPFKAVIRRHGLAEVVRLERDYSQPDDPSEVKRLLATFLSVREETPLDTYEALPIDELNRRALRHATD